METSHLDPLLLIYARLEAGAGGSCLGLSHAEKVTELPNAKALDFVQVLPSSSAWHCIAGCIDASLPCRFWDAA